MTRAALILTVVTVLTSLTTILAHAADVSPMKVPADAAAPLPARADGRYQAGAARMTVADAVPFDVLVAYPTEAAEAAFESGPFTIRASRDAPIALAKAFPVLLFSHGNGRGGTPLNHRDLITALARQGFIVIAPFHTGIKPFRDRPRQLRKAFDQVLADERFAAQADRSRLGILGFSFGGAMSLIAAGATPDFAHLVAYCRGRTDDPLACDGVDTNDTSHIIFRQAADVLPVKAIVLMDPFGAPFDREALTAVAMPVLLYRATRSELRAEGNILALAAAMPSPPRQESVPGSHFVFVDPCPPALEKEHPAECRDAEGVDRRAIHHRIEAEVADFFRNKL
jgi:predicted dienelactone hydrolase